MIVGIPNAGQLRALDTINCAASARSPARATFDKAPVGGSAAGRRAGRCESSASCPTRSSGRPSSTPQYGRTPDLAAMPMYCIPFTFKDSFDTKDMRSTGGGDARTTSTSRRAITRWSSSCATRAPSSTPRPIRRIQRAAPAIPAAPHPAKTCDAAGLRAISAAPGAALPANLYDTTRAAAIGSSSGSAVSVSANLAMCSICEETRMPRAAVPPITTRRR